MNLCFEKQYYYTHENYLLFRDCSEMLGYFMFQPQFFFSMKFILRIKGKKKKKKRCSILKFGDPYNLVYICLYI